MFENKKQIRNYLKFKSDNICIYKKTNEKCVTCIPNGNAHYILPFVNNVFLLSKFIIKTDQFLIFI